ncbi:hypothetical protein [Chryseobacterium sp. SIMBA_029]|uniref:hypothetical protein n=1 Tax=Chryseobacterium sp. SIMBA_029 TaxID=3085772 RepID=UPI003978DBBA
MRIKILLVLLGITLISCNTKASAERKIKRTVTEFLSAVEKDDGSKYKSLIYESEEYPGVISMEKHFLHKNYIKINAIVNLRENIKIKDTIYKNGNMSNIILRIVILIISKNH